MTPMARCLVWGWRGGTVVRKAIMWCGAKAATPLGCELLDQVSRWEGDSLVARTEFDRGGKKFAFKEVFSDFTPTSFTQTLYQGEAGNEPRPFLVMHATRVRE